MRRRIIHGFELLTDGRTVWVNAPDGSNCGRFGSYGVDVHHKHGEGHCEDCFPRGGTHDWDRFVEGIQRVHGVTVPATYEPTP